ncbi:inner membrane protein YpjD [Mariprofundus micogutta]|uniref:Inner membrane protein YpjD n=1 Tax=Mariprofundus micogutta TaxID=1921010 RepID=A0A1L8CPD1_9PROT|nr:cytochrome c biogenesis protein CcsA [Mariprofundus micogutta]GAV20757.1 inner membrane protein YpjD [Mariprofundus micogutta]
MTSTIFFSSAGLISLICAAIVWRGSSQTQSDRSNSANTIVGLMAVAIGLNIWAIHLVDSVTAEGINFTLATGVAVSTLIVQCIYTLGVIRHGIQGLGLFLLPATAIPLFIIPVLPEAHAANWVHTSSLLETSHLLLSLISYAVLTLAAIHALMQILLDRALKKKRMSKMIQALPSLVSIERHMMAQVKAATILIALSILTGLVWQWVEYQHFALLNHKVLLAIFTLAVLITLMVKRQQASWPTRLASRAVLTAYTLLMLAYFGVKLITSWVN